MFQLVFNGLVTGFLVALPAVALSLTFSVLRFANFAIGAMLTTGAYLIYACNQLLGLGLVWATLLGGALPGYWQWLSTHWRSDPCANVHQ